MKNMALALILAIISFGATAKVYKNKTNKDVVIQKRWHQSVNQECSKDLSECLEAIKKKQKIELPDNAKANEKNCYRNGGKIRTLTNPDGDKEKFCFLNDKYLMELKDYNSYHK